MCCFPEISSKSRFQLEDQVSRNENVHPEWSPCLRMCSVELIQTQAIEYLGLFPFFFQELFFCINDFLKVYLVILPSASPSPPCKWHTTQLLKY